MAVLLPPGPWILYIIGKTVIDDNDLQVWQFHTSTIKLRQLSNRNDKKPFYLTKNTDKEEDEIETMVEPQRHEMRLERTHTTGADKWFCPTCGRRFLMQWPPDYKKIILEVGDEQAIHSGGKGGLHIGPVEVRPGGIDDTEITPEPQNRLSDELRTWLSEAGFEDWWHKDD